MTTKTLQPPVKPTATIRPLPVPDYDVPQSFMIDHASCSALTIDWAAISGSGGGTFQVPLDPVTNASFLDVTQFRRINVWVGTTKAEAWLYLGMWAPQTACEGIQIPADAKIHGFDVMGPQMHLELRGNKSLGTEKVQLWVYLRS